ncbi:MAG: molybdate ABC transporter substrate-binding protein [Filomicrobium sp.]
MVFNRAHQSIGLKLLRALAPISLALAVWLIQPSNARADTVLVAVAANFVEPLKELAKDFETETGHNLKISAGATGHLFAQIKHGAPFDLFLSADAERPRLLVEAGLAVADSRFTYATGQLVWWAPKASGNDASCQTASPCLQPNDRRLAIANPKLAPYGLAAQQVLKARPDWSEVKLKLVYGQNIAQTFAMVSTGNADAGLIAYAQLARLKSPKGRATKIDPSLHGPIQQDAVLLTRAKGNAAAKQFLTFLQSVEARRKIEAFGYLHGEPAS